MALYSRPISHAATLSDTRGGLSLETQVRRLNLVVTAKPGSGGFVGHLPASCRRVALQKLQAIREYRRPFGVALPVPRSNGHGRRHSAGFPSRCKRISARALG